MISVRFRPAPDLPWIRVELPDERLEAVLKRAGERVFPGPFDPMEEAGSEQRFQTIMRERAARKAKNK